MVVFSFEQYVFIILLLAGIVGVVFTVNKKQGKRKAFPLALAFFLFLIAVGVFGPLFFNLPSTPFAIMSTLSFSAPPVPPGGPQDVAPVTVTVWDSDSNAPVKDAVIIIEAEDTVVATGLTDADGKFSVKTPFKRLTVSAYVAPFSTSMDVAPPSTQVKLFLPISISSQTSKPKGIVPIGPPIFSDGKEIKVGSGGRIGGGGGGGNVIGGGGGGGGGRIGRETTGGGEEFQIPPGGQLLFRQGRLIVWRMITNHKAIVPPGGEEVFVATVTIFAKNIGDASIDSLYLQDEIPIGTLKDVLGTSPEVFSVQEGSVIVTMFFDSIKPAETKNGKVSLRVDSPVTDKDVLSKFKTPIAVAKQGVDVVQVEPSQSPVAGFDLKVLGLILVLVIAAAVSIFFFKRR